MVESFVVAALALFPLGLQEEVQFWRLSLAVERGDSKEFNVAFESLRRTRDKQRLVRLIIPHLATSKDPLQWDLLWAVKLLPAEVRIEAMPEMVKIAIDEKSTNRAYAVECLGYLGPRAKPAVKTLTECLKVNEPTLQAEACVALWKIEQCAELIAPTLNSLLKSRWAGKMWAGNRTCLIAIEAIAKIGAPLKETEVGATVVQLIDEFDPWIRMEVYPLIPVFAKTKQAAAQQLCAALLRASDQVDAFTKAREEGRISLEEAAMARHRPSELGAAEGALLLLGDEAVPELVKLLHLDKHHTARISALWVLKQLGKGGVKAADEVRKLTNDQDETVRKVANATLKAITAR